MQGAVYLDHNATTPLRAGVAEAMAEALARGGNPSSVHRFGRLARRALETAREGIAALVGAPASGLVFTSGGTEANALAVRGCGRRRILVSAVEHVSVLGAASHAEIIPVDGEGTVDLGALAAMLGADDTPALVSVMLANNETGAVQPVAEVARLGHPAGALVHCDAVQAAGRIPVDMAALGVDMLSLSAHKMGGPQGAGALVLADGVRLEAMLRGGGQERRLRAGTENVPAAAGFAVAAAVAAADLVEARRTAALRDDLEGRIRSLAPGTRVFASAARRLPNTSCFTMPGVAAETQVMALDLAGFAVSAGAACSSGKVGPSHVLAAMGVEADEAASAIRVSLGWNSEQSHVERFVAAWGALYARLGGRAVSSAA